MAYYAVDNLFLQTMRVPLLFCGYYNVNLQLGKKIDQNFETGQSPCFLVPLMTLVINFVKGTLPQFVLYPLVLFMVGTELPQASSNTYAALI